MHRAWSAKSTPEMRLALASWKNASSFTVPASARTCCIMPQATAFAVPGGFTLMQALPGVTKIDVLRVAMLQNALALLPADGIVLHEIDWADIELTKTKDGAYLFSNPQGTVSPRMWGLPVVSTPAMTAGDFLVGNFLMGATVYDRMGVEVLISTENVDDFETNRATMRAEERWYRCEASAGVHQGHVRHRQDRPDCAVTAVRYIGRQLQQGGHAPPCCSTRGNRHEIQIADHRHRQRVASQRTAGQGFGVGPDRADVLEAEALAIAGFAESTNEAATVKTIAEKREVADDDADVETELSELLEGNVETVNEAIDAAFDDLTAEQLKSLSVLEAKGKNRKGVLDHIAQYLDAE